MKVKKIILLLVFFVIFPNKLMASGYGLQIGTFDWSTGGTNPVDVGYANFEFSYITQSKQSEIDISILPGIFWSRRIEVLPRTQFLLGGGLWLIAPGILAGVSVDLYCPWNICLTLSYKQAVYLVLPTSSSLRLGVFLWTK